MEFMRIPDGAADKLGQRKWRHLRKTEVSVSRHLSKRKQLFDFFLDVKF